MIVGLGGVPERTRRKIALQRPGKTGVGDSHRRWIDGGAWIMTRYGLVFRRQDVGDGKSSHIKAICLCLGVIGGAIRTGAIQPTCNAGNTHCSYCR